MSDDKVFFGQVEGHTTNDFPGKKMREQVVSYTANLKASLNLGDWLVKIMWHENAPSHANAEITIFDGRKLATLRLCSDFFQMSLKEQKYSLIHELIHCHLHLIQDQVRCDLPRLLGSAGYDAFFYSAVRGIEHAVDGLAVSFAAYMPDPPWTT